jgi:hypothetical protein
VHPHCHPLVTNLLLLASNLKHIQRWSLPVWLTP